MCPIHLVPNTYLASVDLAPPCCLLGGTCLGSVDGDWNAKVGGNCLCLEFAERALFAGPLDQVLPGLFFSTSNSNDSFFSALKSFFDRQPKLSCWLTFEFKTALGVEIGQSVELGLEA